jgi:poly-gamma-glutamate synthesis protein (capsule biosynthesis protein)
MLSNLLSVAFVGDIAFVSDDAKYINTCTDDYAAITDADILVGNMEFPFTLLREKASAHSHEKYIAPSEAINTLEKVNFSAMSIANNHIYDWGLEGIESTVGQLAVIRVATFGAGRNEVEASKPFFVERQGVRLAFLAFCKEGQWSAGARKPGAAVLRLQDVIERIHAVRKEVHHVIAVFHWGVEFSEYPHPSDIAMAHRVIEAGASCIIGHHPHVVQGMEVYRGKPIFYSLGSFIYDPFCERVFVSNKLEERLTSIGVKLEFQHDSVARWTIYPFAKEKRCLFPRRMSEEEERAFSKKFEDLSKRVHEGDAWFYREAFKNLARREILTVFRNIWESRGRSLFLFLRGIKTRHFIMIFRAVTCRIRRPFVH